MQITSPVSSRPRTSHCAVLLAGFLCGGVALGVLPGCGTSPATQAGDNATEEDIRNFEATFQPSDFDPIRERPADKTPRRADTSTIAVADSAASPPNMEMVPGYRVQVFSTTSIDAARARRLEFEAAFPEEWFYLEYHAPTYKLRAGNFQNRFEAERFARMLAEQGYQEAWAVPEKVFKSPGKRPVVVPAPE